MANNVEFIVYFTVPKCKEAMESWLPGITDYEKYDHFEIKECDNDTLWEFYDQLNKQFNIIIDNCEDETLSFPYLAKASEMAEQFSLQSLNDIQKEVLSKLISAINSGIKYGTCVYFDF